MRHEIRDFGLSSDAAVMVEAAYDYGFGCDACASEETLDGGWLPGAADGNSDSIAIGEDVLCVPQTPDSFD